MEILDLKEGKMSAVQYFYQLLDPEIRRGVTICVVPSSNSEIKESRIGKLGEMLAGNGRKNMDDVTTAGNSLYACKEILLQNGAREVEMFALGKAI